MAEQNMNDFGAQEQCTKCTFERTIGLEFCCSHPGVTIRVIMVGKRGQAPPKVPRPDWCPIALGEKLPEWWEA